MAEHGAGLRPALATCDRTATSNSLLQARRRVRPSPRSSPGAVPPMNTRMVVRSTPLRAPPDRRSAHERQRPSRDSRRVLSPPGRGLPRRPLGAEPRRAARPDRRDARRADAVRGAAHLRGRRGSRASSFRCSRARSDYEEEIMQEPAALRRGHHRLGGREPPARLDEPGAPRPTRASTCPGTPVEPEAMITVPLIARGALKGALNIYRIGEDAVVLRARVRAREVVRRRGRARPRQRADPRASRASRSDRLAHRPLQPPLLPRAPARPS